MGDGRVGCARKGGEIISDLTPEGRTFIVPDLGF